MTSWYKKQSKQTKKKWRDFAGVTKSPSWLELIERVLYWVITRHGLITCTLESESRGQRFSHCHDMGRMHGWEHPLGASHSQMANKKIGPSVLKPEGIEFCQQPVQTWKRMPSLRWDHSPADPFISALWSPEQRANWASLCPFEIINGDDF